MRARIFFSSYNSKMALNEYRKKRHFGISPEPSGEKTAPKNPKSSLIYVVQKHRATQLHYDFRLEFRGTLLSWAVPKGPSLDPSVKRLAMQVEDHPVEYASFEGVIPEGEYGGGTVMVWDTGTWSAESPDVAAALEKGDLKFALHGKKLKGSWVLVRTRGFGSSTKTSWLLIKHRDEFASEDDITLEKPRSAISNRMLAQIARDGRGDVEKAATGDPAPASPPTSRQKMKPITAKDAAKKTAAKSASGSHTQKRRKASR
jgi:bifunctional non-homologous end joining protein LigD